MKPYRGDTGSVGWLSFLGQASLPRLYAIAIAALLLLPFGARPALAAPNSAAAASTAHVYLLRGVLNIFSLGLDDIAAQLRAQGIPVTVANFASWSSLAEEAAAAYKSGRIKTIVLVGHSSGATALPDMVAKLDQLGAPSEAGNRPGFSVSHQALGARGTLRKLLHCQRQRRAGRKDRAIPGQAREHQCAERSWRRAHVHRKEPDHAAEGDKRDRRRRLRPICTIFGGAEVATAWSGRRDGARRGKGRSGTRVVRTASQKRRMPQILPIPRR